MNVAGVLQRIQRGEPQAFAELVARYERPLFGFLGRMGLSQAQAEDLAQETFLRAWTGLAGFVPERAAFSTWLFTIAHNLACNFLQSAAQRREQPGADTAEPACAQPGPEQRLAQTQDQARLQTALRRLSMPERSVLALVFVQELALADVARIEGDSLAAIKTRVHRAKQRLRSLLQSPDDQETRHG